MRFLLFFVLISLFFFSQVFSQSSTTSDQDIFRNLYDRISDVVTPGLNADGTPIQVFLVTMPGISIRREDYDPTIWRKNGFADRSPDALVAELVDAVPSYSSIVWADSGRRVSNMWSLLLNRFQVPLGANPLTDSRVNVSETLLANGTLASEVELLSKALEDQVEENLASRERCLADRQPAVCSQLAVSWRSSQRRKWFAYMAKATKLEAAQALGISAYNADLNLHFTNALENFVSYSRVDVGAQNFGAQYQATYLTPSNWYTWWPLDASAYDAYTDSRSAYSYTFTATCGSCTLSIYTQPSHGTYAISGQSIIYTATPGYVGVDSIGWLESTSSTPVIMLIGNNGDVLSSGTSAWISVSITDENVVSLQNSEYGAFHYNNKLRAGDAMKFSGNFNTTGIPATNRVPFWQAGTSFQVSFEIAKVTISRPWLDLSLLDLQPVAITGVRYSGWSDGNPFFAQVSSYAFKLLPVSFVVARNIKLQSDSISTYSAQISDTFDDGGQSSLQIGPFYTGFRQTAASDAAPRTYTGGSISSGVLTIDGPQIIGFVCAPLPLFPSAVAADIRTINLANGFTYGNLTGISPLV